MSHPVIFAIISVELIDISHRRTRSTGDYSHILNLVKLISCKIKSVSLSLGITIVYLISTIVPAGFAMAAVHNNDNMTFSQILNTETQSCLATNGQSKDLEQASTPTCQNNIWPDCAACTQLVNIVPDHVIPSEPELDIFTNIIPSRLTNLDLTPVPRPPKKFLSKPNADILFPAELSRG